MDKNISIDLLNRECSFKSTKWLEDNKCPKSFAIINAILFSRGLHLGDVEIIDLIISENTSKATNNLKCSFSDIKTNSNEVIDITTSKFDDEYCKRYNNIIKNIINQTYGEVTVANGNEIKLEKPITLKMQDVDMHESSVGDTYTYYITGVKYRSAKIDLERFVLTCNP